MSRRQAWLSNPHDVVSYAESPSRRRVDPVTRRSHHLLTLSAALVAVAVAAGVATPRPRLGRERALRTVAVAASTRPDQPCAWGPTEDPETDVTVATGDTVAHPDLPAGVDGSALLPWCPLVARAVALRLLPDPDAAAAAANARTGPPPGRAPPAFRS
jgi:hypothetical protein